MKKIVIIVACLLVFSLINGCSQGSGDGSTSVHQSSSSQADSSSSKAGSSSSVQDKNNSSTAPKNKTEEKQSSEKIGTLKKTLADVRLLLKKHTPLLLPQKLPIENGSYVSAVVKNQASEFTITFKQTGTPLKVNDKALSKAKTIATMTRQIYSNESEAAKQMTYHQYGSSDGEAVPLGHQITGYADAGAGTAGISWNEGRWTLASLSPTSESAKGQQLARFIVDYLEEHALPVPRQYGQIQAYTDNRQSMIRWQDRKSIYELTGNDPMVLLEIAVSIK
ncbi:hypothetical protein NIE88_13810 [Sporolactobacillus shoreicorticis]|uniref:Lipoprotein n=1 Tax=Sporolactobacillus shoreicorticis TaxID=1923877 RepID=A0ABW5S8I8_9BACL|nr:hypothetical protein [Sporolactobacillus shoreicorticis]MCO7126843.1 hypothetical protein [Sporolactobacillus shoreicorticis]